MNNASYTLHNSARLLDPVHVGLPREVHVVVRQLIVILQWLAPLWLQFLHLRQLFTSVHIQRTYFVIAENIWRTMNQVPRVNTQKDNGRNSSKRIADTVDSHQRHKSRTTNIKKERRTQTKYMQCKADVMWPWKELLIPANQQRRYFHTLKQPIFWQTNWRTSNRLLLCTTT